MITRQELQAAIGACRWVCVECGSDQITARLDRGEWIPDTGHWAGDAWHCPALDAGSAAMIRCWLDVNDDLQAAGLPIPHYGAEARFSRRVSA